MLGAFIGTVNTCVPDCDPLTPEVLDDLETLLLRADAGVSATDQILESLRTKLN